MDCVLHLQSLWDLHATQEVLGGRAKGAEQMADCIANWHPNEGTSHNTHMQHRHTHTAHTLSTLFQHSQSTLPNMQISINMQNVLWKKQLKKRRDNLLLLSQSQLLCFCCFGFLFQLHFHFLHAPSSSSLSSSCQTSAINPKRVG